MGTVGHLTQKMFNLLCQGRGKTTSQGIMMNDLREVVEVDTKKNALMKTTVPTTIIKKDLIKEGVDT